MKTISFGKFANTPLPEVPMEYLMWGEQNFRGATLALVQEELEKRKTLAAGKGWTTKLARDVFATELSKLFQKVPDGLQDQTLQINGYELKIRKL